MITYKRLENSSYIVSGTHGDKIFYLKRVFSHDKFIQTLEFEYPEVAKERFDEIIQKLAPTFPVCK